MTIKVTTNGAQTTEVIFCIFGVDDERSDAPVAGQDPPMPTRRRLPPAHSSSTN